MINGIFVIDKAQGMTSADVVYKLRKILHTRKIGHAGTLDPDVTGVLPIAVGQATKLIELMHTQKKQYRGSGIIGFATDSYDLAGHKLAEKPVEQAISQPELQRAMDHLTGEITQVPPIYSAVKVNGKRLYEYARAGIEVERPSRQVTVSQYQLLAAPHFDPETRQVEFSFEVTASKGTYVRSLVNDLATFLDYPCVMKSLRRTSAAGFDLTHAVTLEELEQASDPAQYLCTIEDFFNDYPVIDLTQDQFAKVKNGAWLAFKSDAKELALRYNGKVKAIYVLDQKVYRPSLMLLQNE